MRRPASLRPARLKMSATLYQHANEGDRRPLQHQSCVGLIAAHLLYGRDGRSEQKPACFNQQDDAMTRRGRVGLHCDFFLSRPGPSVQNWARPSLRFLRFERRPSSVGVAPLSTRNSAPLIAVSAMGRMCWSRIAASFVGAVDGPEYCVSSDCRHAIDFDIERARP